MHAFTRKTSTWSFSLGLHVLSLLGFAFFWVVRAEEEVTVLRTSACSKVTECPLFPQREAEEHPPIVPKDFQPDPEIINDAREVIVNTIPTEIDSARESGESPYQAAPNPFRAPAMSGTIGAGGGGGGRFGAYAARFG